MSNTKIKTENIIIQTRGKPILSDKQARVFSTAIAADISKYISENQEKFDE